MQEELQERSRIYLDYTIKLSREARKAFYELRKTSIKTRNQILKNLVEILKNPVHQETIITKNEIDLEKGKKNNLSEALLDRLKLNEKRIQEIIQSLEDIIALPDPINEISKGYTLSNGIELIQKKVPIGVIFTIYESRPNVTIDVGALCIKSGNAVILRGGKEAFSTNQILYQLFKEAIIKENISPEIIQFVEETDRACMYALLQQDSYIDLVVPRGGESLIKFITENTRIPVIKHDKGVCNLYIDSSADLNKSIEIAINAKLQRPSVCNAIENLIFHKDFPHIREVLESLKNKGAILLGCEETEKIFPPVELIQDPDKEYSTEYLDNRLSVKIVKNLDEAIEFIHKYGSGHSEGIVAENYSAIEEFERKVDSAALFINCSTRFHDGGQMGMGAEIGISTNRLHVRGPMGLKDLTTTTYILRGNGQIRT